MQAASWPASRRRGPRRGPPGRRLPRSPFGHPASPRARARMRPARRPPPGIGLAPAPGGSFDARGPPPLGPCAEMRGAACGTMGGLRLRPVVPLPTSSRLPPRHRRPARPAGHVTPPLVAEVVDVSPRNAVPRRARAGPPASPRAPGAAMDPPRRADRRTTDPAPRGDAQGHLVGLPELETPVQEPSPPMPSLKCASGCASKRKGRP